MSHYKSKISHEKKEQMLSVCHFLILLFFKNFTFFNRWQVGLNKESTFMKYVLPLTETQHPAIWSIQPPH